MSLWDVDGKHPAGEAMKDTSTPRRRQHLVVGSRDPVRPVSEQEIVDQLRLVRKHAKDTTPDTADYVRLGIYNGTLRVWEEWIH